ncbi:MAG: hypothetical protein CK425_07600 [Parachlamydia sp.]|nr:MAG: hypothetical protein CK425_07600 [Parachlamydia sp.]
MGSLNQKLRPTPENIYCMVRKEWVAALPEEYVRQALLNKMIHELGFPQELIGVEQGLKQMPHLGLSGGRIPERRADIICFGKKIHPQHSIYPLLIVECKAVKLSAKTIHQVVGYNHHVKAYYVALANQAQLQLGWYDSTKQDYTFIPFLPSYQELMQAVQFG